MSSQYHEDHLSDSVKDDHRALVSLQEELEAVDWYNQRVDVATDEGLKAILIHNRNEEIEHAAMLMEWLRRHLPAFDKQMATYLFKKLPITELEEAEESEGAGNIDTGDGSLGIGSAKKQP